MTSNVSNIRDLLNFIRGLGLNPKPTTPPDPLPAFGAERLILDGKDVSILEHLVAQDKIRCAPKFGHAANFVPLDQMPQPPAPDMHPPAAQQESDTMTSETKAAPKRRKYYLRHKETGKERIIIGASPAQSVRYASRSDYDCELLDTDTALRLGAAGVVPEEATDAPETEQGDLLNGGNGAGEGAQ